MKIQINGEMPFQVIGSSFAISPSDSSYELYYSADGVEYTSTGKNVAAGDNLEYKAKAPNLYYKLVGNTSEVTINMMKDCCGGGGTGGGIEEAPEDGKVYGRKDAEWVEVGELDEDSIIFDYNNPVWTQEQLDFINSNPQREEILKRCLIKNGGSYYKVIYADGDNNITCFAQGIALIFGLNWKPKVVGGEQGTYRYDYYRKDEVDSKLEDKQDKLTAGEGITIDEDNVISANVGGLSIIDGFVLTDVFYSMVDSAVIDSKNIEICYNNEVFVPATTTPIIIDGEQVGYRFEGIYSSDDTLYKLSTEIKQSEIGNDIVVNVEEISSGGGGDTEEIEDVTATAFADLNTKVDDNNTAINTKVDLNAVVAKNYADAKALKAQRELDKSDAISAAGIYYSVKSEDDTIKNMISLTQAGYDALTEKDSKTFYIITD